MTLSTKEKKRVKDALGVIEPLYEKYRYDMEKGEVEGFYDPDWWLNKKDDAMYLFFKWALDGAWRKRK